MSMDVMTTLYMTFFNHDHDPRNKKMCKNFQNNLEVSFFSIIFVIPKENNRIMEKKNLYKVTIYNSDRTTIFVIAKNKLDASFKYGDYVKENRVEDFIDEFQDFEIDFVDYVYE